jgi:hypothetical protein
MLLTTITLMDRTANERNDPTSIPSGIPNASDVLLACYGSSAKEKKIEKLGEM